MEVVKTQTLTPEEFFYSYKKTTPYTIYEKSRGNWIYTRFYRCTHILFSGNNL